MVKELENRQLSAYDTLNINDWMGDVCSNYFASHFSLMETDTADSVVAFRSCYVA